MMICAGNFSEASNIPLTEIKTVAVVGGFRGFENDKSSNDYRMVMPALDYLRQSGIPIKEKPDFDAINFADKRNFLNEDKEYDLVFIAHIPNGRNLSWTRMSFENFSHSTDVSTPLSLANTIDSKNSPERWAERLMLSKAKIIMSVGSWIEVTHNYFQKASCIQGYQTVISPKDDANLVGRAEIFDKEKMGLLYGQEIDLPYQWLGISVSNAAYKVFADQSNGRTDFSRALKAKRPTVNNGLSL